MSNYFDDSTSTALPEYDEFGNLVSRLPMPNESQGLGMAAERTLQMFNPVETVKGASQSLSGIANDAVRATGGNPNINNPNAPSFVGDMKQAGKSFLDNPGEFIADTLMSPGSVPAMASGTLVPKIPKGAGYKHLRDRPGIGPVRDVLKKWDQYSYVGGPNTKPILRRRGEPLINEQFVHNFSPFEKRSDKFAKTWDENKAIAAGIANYSTKSLIYPQRLRKVQKEMLQEGFGESQKSQRPGLL